MSILKVINFVKPRGDQTQYLVRNKQKVLGYFKYSSSYSQMDSRAIFKSRTQLTVWSYFENRYDHSRLLHPLSLDHLPLPPPFLPSVVGRGRGGEELEVVARVSRHHRVHWRKSPPVRHRAPDSAPTALAPTPDALGSRSIHSDTIPLLG